MPPPSSFIKTLFLFFLIFTTYLSSDAEGYTTCEPFSCGKFNNISFPFWRSDQPEYCGHPKLKLDCQQDNVTIDMMSHTFYVIDIKPTSKVLKIASVDLLDDPCPNEYISFELDFDFFNYTSNDGNYTLLYDCSPNPLKYSLNLDDLKPFSCPIDSGFQEAFFVSSSDVANLMDLVCNKNISVSVLREAVKDTSFVKDVIKEGFEVLWSGVDEDQCDGCKQHGGRCGHNASVDEFICLCYNQQSYGGGCSKSLARSPLAAPTTTTRPTPANSLLPPNSLIFPKNSPLSPHAPSTLNLPRKIIIGVGSAVVGALAVGIGVYLYWRRKKNSYVTYIQSRSLSFDPSLKDTEKGTQSFTQSFVHGMHLFSYDELEEATNYFDSSKELGEGGFGTVYYGKLRDGRSVAVKRLYENNYRRVEQFMNEIKILALLKHPNLVSLYGCTSRHSRELLLVYEYIPNGTVADHLHSERSKPGTLPWLIRMNIAVETASALTYLHVKDIIHRDVKTNNILLDSNFRVKVADFGLSRLFPEHVTHVSTAPQGTPGYVDPEYHECYQLTNKSDVYSFGVVLVELISSLPAVDITRHRHEINLANMAINKIHSQALHELVDPTLGFESDFKVRKMINAVAELAFQCLQSSKDMRPSMEEVFDTLKDIQSDGKHKSQPEVMDISSTADDVVLLKDNPPPPSPDSNAVSKSTTPNASG
ncbi:LEAF RUST 10 DISEASE-RESISTANCE LOCUS RECEPTOR-LIKE PROTEIN KINASE-like 1.2 isoform X1 [Cajanus cajan]|uniref:LEAF RUST 10 DISEASE-RESISTANCE LOCUS RECEPTOR-LIKE PROTEIN KINASE-like 1.2 isoform X1 n=1 Tax=Cajanus cajan TaxID=3821 RepID=UPI00098DA66D|nr:LEAF RUST 10 DISEASE-RESISTANCE LOCUS RECEPTOR-LIKE PROTEIN KINASE-like 1.2 isoform X1 [Cajanus cajan]